MRVVDDSERAVTIELDGAFVIQYGDLGCNPPVGCVPAVYRVTAPDGGVTRYVYTYPGSTPSESDIRAREAYKITQVFSPTDQTTPFLNVSYDSLFRVKSITDNSSAARTTTYYSTGLFGTEEQKRGQTVDPLGAQTTSYFDKNGSMTRQIDPLGRITRNTYDTYSRLTGTFFPEGNSILYTYDARHNRLTTNRIAKPGIGALQPIGTATSYVEGPNVTACINPKTCNKPATETDALGRSTTYSWGAATGLLNRISRPATTVAGVSVVPTTSLCYDGPLLVGRIDRLTNTTTRVSRFSYDANNKYTLNGSIVDPVASITENCAAVNKPTGLALLTAYAFDSVGNVRTIDGPRADVADINTYTFDPMRRIKQIDGPAGTNIKTLYNYDADGLLRTLQRQEMVNGTPTLRTETRDYFPNGQLKSVTDPNSKITQYAYDQAGRTDVVTDPDNRRIKTIYDLAGQTRCTWKGWKGSFPAPADAAHPCDWTPGSYPNTSNGALRYAAYSYSDNGKQTSIQDANNNLTTYSYDSHDRNQATIFPDGSTESIWYTLDGTDSTALCSASNQVCRKKLRNNQTITYRYDPLDRLFTKQPTGTGLVTFAYNLIGEPLSVNEAAGPTINTAAHTTVYAYDGAGRRISETNDGAVVAVQYDAAGNRTRLTWPAGYFVSYEYDIANRMSAIRELGTTELALWGYDSLSRPFALRLGGADTNGVSYSYEPNSRLDFLAHNFNGVGLLFDHNYNNSGQITGIVASDDFYLAKPIPSTQYAINNLNQYSSIDGTTATYDGNGNMLTRPASGGLQTYTYDSENRLTSIAINGSASASIFYDYDGLGRRVTKRTGAAANGTGGTVTRYLLDGDEDIAEYSEGGVLQKRYVNGARIDQRIAMIDVQAGNLKSLYHVNHQGSVIATTAANGTLQQRYSYDEYGNLSGAVSTSGQPFRFTGRRFDEESGLYYYRARHYSPTIGRFLQVDPVGYEPDLNLYSYVFNNPINVNDPTGKCGYCIPIFAGAAVGTLTYVAAMAAINETPTWGGVFGSMVSGGIGGATLNFAFSASAGASFAGGILIESTGGAVAGGLGVNAESLVDNRKLASWSETKDGMITGAILQNTAPGIKSAASMAGTGFAAAGGLTQGASKAAGSVVDAIIDIGTGILQNIINPGVIEKEEEKSNSIVNDNFKNFEDSDVFSPVNVFGN